MLTALPQSRSSGMGLKAKSEAASSLCTVSQNGPIFPQKLLGDQPC